jgi:hypothetical protein
LPFAAEPQTYDDAQSARAVSTANYEDMDGTGVEDVDYEDMDETANATISGEYGGLAGQALCHAAPKNAKGKNPQQKQKQKQKQQNGGGGQRPRANTQYENTAGSHVAGKPRARASSSAGAAANTGRRGTDWIQTKPVLNARTSQQAVTAVVQSWDSPANAAHGAGGAGAGAGSRPGAAAATKPGINRSARKGSVYLGFGENGEQKNDSDDNDLDV